jgi:hypothetical protein
MNHMKGVFFVKHLHIEKHMVRFYKRSLTSAATTTRCAGSRLGSFGFRAVAGVEPAISFQTERGSGDHLLDTPAALGALAGWCVRELLAQLKLMITGRTFVLVHGHGVSTPSFF